MSAGAGEVPRRPTAPDARRASHRLVPVLLLLATQAGCVRQAIVSRIERTAFVTPRPGTLTPDSLGVPAERVDIASGDRKLHGSWVRAPGAAAPALLIFHGDDETVSDWAAVQARLGRAGISTLVFDYSGYGASTGRPTVKRMREDALAAYREFDRTAPPGSPLYLLGYSLGSAVLLDVAAELRPAPDAVIVAAGFASTREIAVSRGLVPGWIAWALPNLWNNEARVAELELPLLIVHSRADRVVPFHHAERLARAARGPNRLIALEGLGHDAPLAASQAGRFWDPLIEHLARPASWTAPE